MRNTESRKGAALLVITISVIIMAVSLSVALPGVKNDLKRDKEDKLRFVLSEFRRAVDKYKLCNGKMPETFDDLICDENGNRFLRQKYHDPFTGKFDWQFEAASDSFTVYSSSEEKSLASAAYSQFR